MTTMAPPNNQIGLLRLALERRPELEETASCVRIYKNNLLIQIEQAEENVYSIVLYPKFSSAFRYLLPTPNAEGERIVRFKKFDQNTQLPSPAILEAHAALARVLNASGMAEEIEKILRDQEKIKAQMLDMHEFSHDVPELLMRKFAVYAF